MSKHPQNCYITQTRGNKESLDAMRFLKNKHGISAFFENNCLYADTPELAQQAKTLLKESMIDAAYR